MKFFFFFTLNCDRMGRYWNIGVRAALTSPRAHATHPAASIGPCVTRSREEVVSFNPQRCSDSDRRPTRTDPSLRHAPPVQPCLTGASRHLFPPGGAGVAGHRCAALSLRSQRSVELYAWWAKRRETEGRGGVSRGRGRGAPRHIFTYFRILFCHMTDR